MYQRGVLPGLAVINGGASEERAVGPGQRCHSIVRLVQATTCQLQQSTRCGGGVAGGTPSRLEQLQPLRI